MSIGVGGGAQLVYYNVAKDSYAYMYWSYNLNDEEHRNEERIHDGKIYIRREAFPKLEMHIKKQKMPSGKKKLITKRIVKGVAIAQLISEGLIMVKNTSNCWKTGDEGVDIVENGGMIMHFESWDEYASYCKSVYFDFEDDISWIKHIGSPDIIDEPQILDNLCIGNPGVYCIQENTEIACDQCLLDNIKQLKRMLEMSDVKRE